MEYKELYRIAQDMVPMAYAPYSKFHVGAALLAESGKVYTGINVENASYGGTICAERTAAVKAVSEGERKFTAIAVASSGGEAMPCGICRQFLFEFDDGLVVISGEDEEHLHINKLVELLPGGFEL